MLLTTASTFLDVVRPFFLVNGFVLAVALATTCKSEASGFLAEWACCLCRDAAIVLFLTLMTLKKERIQQQSGEQQSPSWSSWLRLALVAAPFDAIVATIAKTRLVGVLGRESASRFVSPPPVFLALSFAFEVIFDFFHYWTHRACHLPHTLRYLSRCHSIHHASSESLRPLATYDQSATDVVFCNVIPALLALCILQRCTNMTLTRHEWSLLWTYKSYVEVAGHAGVHSRATCFPQFVWLPRMLGIALRTVDHDLHHSSKGRACNFSKRFTLWDQVFGTFVSSPFSHNKVER